MSNSKYIVFTKEAQQIIDDLYIEAYNIWGGNFNEVRILAGNYSGYGKYVAHYVVGSKLIEVPLNSSYNTVLLYSKGIGIINKARFSGLLLHELAHHHVHYHMEELDFKAGYSTHSTAEWCYICATGWNYYDKELNLAPETLAIGINNKTEGLNKAMSHFNPFKPPYKIIENLKTTAGHSNYCIHCELPFHSKRASAKFCSSKCRTANSRKQKKELLTMFAVSLNILLSQNKDREPKKKFFRLHTRIQKNFLPRKTNQEAKNKFLIGKRTLLKNLLSERRKVNFKKRLLNFHLYKKHYIKNFRALKNKHLFG